MLSRSITTKIIRNRQHQTATFKKIINSCRGSFSPPISTSITHRWHTNAAPDTPVVNIIFQYPTSREDGKTVNAEAHVGENILNVAKRYGIELEGACEGVCACSTCHVVLESNVYDRVEEPVEDEEDMLDMAFGLTPTSRLGCQIEVTEDIEGAIINLPAATRNFYVDGHVPVGH